MLLITRGSARRTCAHVHTVEGCVIMSTCVLVFVAAAAPHLWATLLSSRSSDQAAREVDASSRVGLCIGSGLADARPDFVSQN